MGIGNAEVPYPGEVTKPSGTVVERRFGVKVGDVVEGDG